MSFYTANKHIFLNFCIACSTFTLILRLAVEYMLGFKEDI